MESDATQDRLLIAMAGLPGTGKSTIASLLAERLHALVLNKDAIRARLFSGTAVDFSRAQDDLCLEVIFIVAEYVLRANTKQTIIIDGRTFSQSYQVEHLFARAGSLNVKPAVIEYVCSDTVARQRLDEAQRTGAHPAGNRTYQLYLALKNRADPLTADRLVIDTGREPVEKSVERCLTYLRRSVSRAP
ncbi:MAG TPA: ATP-binding protein [Nitrospirota bacterium]|nr:ATP-binding protein [Nitrospirota bacterium]